MCWTGRKIIDKIPRIAWKDIDVYKVMTIYGKSGDLNFEYEFDKEMPKIKLGIDRYMDFMEINEGYHSYYGKCKIADHLAEFNLDCEKVILPHSMPYEKYGIVNRYVNLNYFHIHKAVIPRGTKYYINEYGEIVSERIIVKSQKVEI